MLFFKDKTKLRAEFWTIFRYGCIGVLNTMVFSIVAYAVNKMGFHYSVYTAAGYTCGIIFSFFMNYNLTFNSQSKSRKLMFVRFITLSLSLLGLTELIQYVLIELASLKKYTALYRA